MRDQSILGASARLAAMVAMLTVAMVLFAVPGAWAADLTVTNTNDSGPGSLRAALGQASSNGQSDTISFDLPQGEDEITLTSGELAIDPSFNDRTLTTTIKGPGAEELAVSGNGTSRVFKIGSGTVAIEGLTIRDGLVSGGPGGGILNVGTLTLSDSAVSGNRANTVTPLAGLGGGIANLNRLTLSDSTLSGNGAGTFGGGIYSGTSVTGGRTTIRNSTISGNTSSRGVVNDNGLTTIENTTISDNAGGGVFNLDDNATTELYSTIVSDNGGSDVLYPLNGTNTFTSRGYNLVGSGNAAGTFTEPGDQTGVADPGLGPLADNGGGTRTHMPLSGSPAMDRGKASEGLATDQRGVARPHDYPWFANASGDGSDVGAVEAAEPAVSVSGAVVTEGTGGQGPRARFEVRLSEPAASEVKVDFTTADDGAVSPGDYEAAAGTLTFAPGEGAKIVEVPVVPDALDEPTESFFLNLSNPVGLLLVDARATGTIQDDDAAPSLSVGDASVSEPATGTADVTFDVELSAPSGKPVSVDYASADGTATVASGDYAEISGSLYFKPGETERSAAVPVHADVETEAAEDLFLKLSGAENAGLADDEGRATVTDTPPAEELTISVSGASVSEGDAGTTEAHFHVNLSRAASGTVTVDYATEDDDANAPDDYSETSGTLAFSAGENTRTIAVPIRGDELDEPTEGFFLDLSDPAGAAIAGGRAAAAIQDDDEAVSVSVGDVAVTEGSSRTTDAAFTLSLSGPSGKPVSAEYSTSDGTAKAAEADYSETSGTAYFKPGMTERTVVVPVRADAKGEQEEDFFLNLSAPENASVADGEGRGTIADSAPVVLRVRPADGAMMVGRRANVTAVFSKEMDPASLNSATFYLSKAGSAKKVGARVLYDAAHRRAILNPNGKLSARATYTATLEGGAGAAQDLSGKTLESGESWTFKVRR